MRQWGKIKRMMKCVPPKKQRWTMRNETLAIHAGYDPDPTTKSVAVPIYRIKLIVFVFSGFSAGIAGARCRASRPTGVSD